MQHPFFCVESDKNVTKEFILESFSFSNICYNEFKLASNTELKHVHISGGKINGNFKM